MKPKKLTLDKEELTLAQLAGELSIPFKVTVTPHKPKLRKRAKRVRSSKLVGAEVWFDGPTIPKGDIDPTQCLARFDVTIEAQALDIQLRRTHKGLFSYNVKGCLDEAKNQMDWAITNRLKELKMKMGWEDTMKMDISHL